MTNTTTKYCDTEDNFKWRHFEGNIILQCVRWYCEYALSYRDLEEMMGERGLKRRRPQHNLQMGISLFSRIRKENEMV